MWRSPVPTQRQQNVNILCIFDMKFISDICYLDYKLPWRVRLRSSQPLESNSLLAMSKKLSSGMSSSLLLLCELPLLPPTPIPLSTGITDAMFQTSFNALAFNVAAPRRATQIDNNSKNELKILLFSELETKWLFWVYLYIYVWMYMHIWVNN